MARCLTLCDARLGRRQKGGNEDLSLSNRSRKSLCSARVMDGVYCNEFALVMRPEPEVFQRRELLSSSRIFPPRRGFDRSEERCSSTSHCVFSSRSAAGWKITKITRFAVCNFFCGEFV